MRIEERNFVLLKKVLPELEQIQPETHWRLTAPGYMDLVVECNQAPIEAEHAKTIVLSLSHYGEQNGDLMADPDMVLHVVMPTSAPAGCTTRPPFLIPISWQNDYVGRYSLAFPEYPEMTMVRPNMLKDLTKFLNQWLKNLVEQGHKRTIETQAKVSQ